MFNNTTQFLMETGPVLAFVLAIAMPLMIAVWSAR